MEAEGTSCKRIRRTNQSPNCYLYVIIRIMNRSVWDITRRTSIRKEKISEFGSKIWNQELEGLTKNRVKENIEDLITVQNGELVESWVSPGRRSAEHSDRSQLERLLVLWKAQGPWAPRARTEERRPRITMLVEKKQGLKKRDRNLRVPLQRPRLTCPLDGPRLPVPVYSPLPLLKCN